MIPAFEVVTHDSTVTSATAALVGNQVVQASGDTNMFLGIAEVTMAGSNYGWITTYGPATARVVSAVIPMQPLGPGSSTGVLSIRNTSHFNAAALAVASGLSMGSTVFVSVL